MRRYIVGEDVGPLESWPFDNPSSRYRIIVGRPECSGRMDAGGPGHDTRAGIWRCTAGGFECTEQGDELMTVLDGTCRITDVETGESHALGPGDTLFLRDGMRARWEVPKEVTKVFFGCKAGGY